MKQGFLKTILLKKKSLFPIERLHLIAGFSLVLSGIMAFFIYDVEMAISWGVFGAMYISMSDIGEGDMSEEDRKVAEEKLEELKASAKSPSHDVEGTESSI